MKTISTIPGYRVNEYLLAIYPHEDLQKRIIKLKQDFAEEFKMDKSRVGKPHMLLASFMQYEMMEERIVNRLRTIAMGFPPFKVELKDFGSLPSHSIFINVTSKLPVQNLVKTIRTETQRLMKYDEENKPYFILEPNISVARKLLPWQYEKAWLEYSSKHFSGRFIAGSVSLLKKPDGEGWFYTIANFEFQNMPVNTRQGELFG
jgi:2'-5' RNA ligase